MSSYVITRGANIWNHCTAAIVLMKKKKKFKFGYFMKGKNPQIFGLKIKKNYKKQECKKSRKRFFF